MLPCSIQAEIAMESKLKWSKYGLGEVSVTLNILTIARENREEVKLDQIRMFVLR